MKKILDKYSPMSETGFYILSTLTDPHHGYSIGVIVKKITCDRLKIGPGTMYGTLSKMENDGLINFVGEEANKKVYLISELGKIVLKNEIDRISKLYNDSLGVRIHE